MADALPADLIALRWRYATGSPVPEPAVMRADVLALAEEVERLRADLDAAQTLAIEARNPGIDLEEVRRIRGGAANG